MATLRTDYDKAGFDFKDDIGRGLYAWYANPERLYVTVTNQGGERSQTVLNVEAQEALFALLMRAHEDRIAADANAVPL